MFAWMQELQPGFGKLLEFEVDSSQFVVHSSRFAAPGYCAKPASNWRLDDADCGLQTV